MLLLANQQQLEGESPVSNCMFAHGHLTSKNIFVNPNTWAVQIGDYGMYSLKKFCKVFHGYDMLTKWSAPEVWEVQYQGTDSERNPKFNGKATYFNQPVVDIYSLGVIFWEMEVG